MTKYKIPVIGATCLILGFIIAWFILKPPRNNTPASQHQHITESIHQSWTCSMHPQVRQNEKGDCPICGMDLIPVGQADSDKFTLQMTNEAIKLANIQTTTIGDESKNSFTIRLNGKIEVDETRSSSQVTHIPGRIEKLFVSYTGQFVRKGQKVASIYSPDFITAQQELIEAQKLQDHSRGLFTAAKKKLKYWKVSDQTIQHILRTGTICETLSIYAEYSGIVTQKRVSVGDYLTAGGVLFDVQNLATLWAVFEVYENTLSKIKIGQKITFNTPALPDQSFRAKITFINPVINPKTRTASIRTEVDNIGRKLKPGMFIVGELSVLQKSTKLFVPKSAVLWTGKRSVVYVKTLNSTIPSFTFREVELGEATPTSYAVVKGLEQGEAVVTNGAFVIDASAQLNNQASMMNRHIIEKNAPPSSPLPNYTESTSVEFKKQLTYVVLAYLPMKDALVKTNSDKALSASKDILDALKKVEKPLKTQVQIYWTKQSHAIKSHTQKFSKLKDIEEQRKEFKFLSQILINSLKVYGVENDTFYVQYCPMVNGNQGGTWLSADKKIRNPYFGNKMLTCGNLLDTIHAP